MIEAPRALSDDALKSSAQFAKGVGPSRFPLLQRLGIETVADLLFYFPRSYEDLSDVRPIGLLAGGKMQTTIGEVVEIDGKTLAAGRTLVNVVISDGKQCLEGTWFNQPFMAQRFRYGQQVAFSGKPQWRFGHWQMNNPRVQYLDDAAGALSSEARVLPIYGLTEGLRPEHLRRILKHAVEAFADQVPELLPPELLTRHRLSGMAKALHDIHTPETLKAAQQARRRLVYEEFLILELALAVRRRDIHDRRHAVALPNNAKIDAHIRKLFPFTLTKDQNRAAAEVSKDMGQERPMQRLLQADVGAGKTAVAVYALLVAIANKYQAALMAPTEVLARQHWRTLNQYLAKSRVRRSLLTGGLTPRERRVVLGEIRMGQVDLVVGTQAIIQKDVEFAKLGLVVIDEQHKFGVAQRAQIRKLGDEPHYLILTATPIPRTIALTVFGDLDVSIIRELPPGRKGVITRWVSEKQRRRLETHLCKELKSGRQLYVVCPLVEESETGDIKAAEQTFKALQTGVFRDFAVGLLHGRMDDKDKDTVMVQFREGRLQVLVSTLVIEVGVDVPNATLMVIEHAERFGLSQLHQLRGRVSRGPVAGECYLCGKPVTEDSQRRLRLFVRTTDGFALAEEDARLRGLGEFFGTRQHGLGELKIGNLLTDQEILTVARDDAFAMVAADPSLRNPAYAGLRKAVVERYGKTLDLAEIG